MALHGPAGALAALRFWDVPKDAAGIRRAGASRRGLALAALFAMGSARVGIWWGNGMSRADAIGARSSQRSGLAGLVALCTAHVGSPDVWYEGVRGPYHAIVDRPPPGVDPGIADINVQVVGEQPTQVTAIVNLYNASAGTPPEQYAERRSYYIKNQGVLLSGG